MAENPKLRAWRIRVIAEKNKLSNFPEPLAPLGPSMQDVISIKRLLLGMMLPLEIVDSILDFAELWPHTTCTTQYRTVVYSDKPGLWSRDWRSLPFSMDHGPTLDNFRIFHKNAFLVRTTPLGLHTRDLPTAAKPSVVSRWKQKLRRDRRRRGSSDVRWLPPRGIRPCRKIVFEILSHQEAVDFSEPRYGDSPTWFDVSVERIVPQDDVGGPSVWTASMNEEFGDEVLGHTDDSPQLQVVKKVPGATVERRAKVAGPASAFVEEQPMQLFRTVRTKPSLAATTRQTVVQQNYQGDAIHRSHVITWRYDDDFDMDSIQGDDILDRTGSHFDRDFVRRLESGESVMVWARARNRPRDISNKASGTDPCINVVDRVRVHVFWAV